MAFNFTSTFNDGTLQLALKNWPAKMNISIMQELFRIANDMRNHIIREMKESPPNNARPLIRSGTRYKTNYKNRKFHYPSFKGNFPRIDSGRLVGSIDVISSDSMVAIGSVYGSKKIVKYAKDLEDPKKLNRPFIMPTYKTFKPTIVPRLMEAIRARASKK